ncbi:WD40/YVTN/BNR-like repeat-containing protein [Pseudomonas sp. ZS001]|uniref:WD40/YVTN/BNR-like repeat-containing protein n=1 Tax=Pseudomonas sp. ZS001 TaxID=3138070 RepID=UPI00313A275F
MDNEDSLFFTCGLVIKAGTIVVPGQYNSLPDEQMSRVAFCFDGNWVYNDVDDDVIGAICFRHSDSSLWMLGRKGHLRHVKTGSADFTLANVRGKFENQRIETGRLGELLCIREIANELYICGQSSQVYRHSNGGWVDISPPGAKIASPTLESLDGLSSDDIYAVGEKGLIMHYDGARWSTLDSATNRPLSRVLCKSAEEVYACGNDGVLLVGNRNQWQVLDTERTMNFWDMALYDGQLYIAHVHGLVRYDGKDFFDVDTGLLPAPGAHKLDVGDGLLYSFGVDDILKFDGSRWERVICPHNT